MHPNGVLKGSPRIGRGSLGATIGPPRGLQRFLIDPYEILKQLLTILPGSQRILNGSSRVLHGPLQGPKSSIFGPLQWSGPWECYLVTGSAIWSLGVLFGLWGVLFGPWECYLVPGSAIWSLGGPALKPKP